MIKILISLMTLFTALNTFADKNKTWEQNVLTALAQHGSKVVNCGQTIGNLEIKQIIDQAVVVDTLPANGPSKREVILVGEDVSLYFTVGKGPNGPIVNDESFKCNGLD